MFNFQIHFQQPAGGGDCSKLRAILYSDFESKEPLLDGCQQRLSSRGERKGRGTARIVFMIDEGRFTESLSKHQDPFGSQHSLRSRDSSC